MHVDQKMISRKCCTTSTSTRLGPLAALCVGMLLLFLGPHAVADEIQDINKLFKQSQYEPALQRVDAYLAGTPNSPQARFLKGLILAVQKKTGDAIAIFLSLTEDFPEMPEPYNNLAVLYAGLGQYDKAEVALKTAIRNHPDYPTAQENIGDIYAQLASQAYERTLQLDKKNTTAQAKLTLINDLLHKGKTKATNVGSMQPFPPTKEEARAVK